MKNDYEKIWSHVTQNFKCRLESIHGPSHWRRVEQNGLKIAAINGANTEVVRLFAVFHDSQRKCDILDYKHGERSAQYITKQRGNLFELDDGSFSLLHYACKWHAHGKTSDDPTIGACWDADRLDLTRIKAIPHEKYMSTEPGRRLCKAIHSATPCLSPSAPN